jgi:hypothetical protein
MTREREVETKLRAAEEKIEALSNREFLSLAVISSAMANAMVLVRNHMPEFDTKILRKNITIDDVG